MSLPVLLVVYILGSKKGRIAARAAYTPCDFVSTNAQGNVTIEGAHKAQKNTRFHLTTSIQNAFETVSIGKCYEIIIIEGSASVDLYTWEEIMKDVEPFASTSAFVHLVRQIGDIAAVSGEDEQVVGTTTVDQSLIGMPNGSAHGRAMPSNGLLFDGSAHQNGNEPGFDSRREQASNSKHQLRLSSSSTFKSLADSINCSPNRCTQLPE